MSERGFLLREQDKEDGKPDNTTRKQLSRRVSFETRSGPGDRSAEGYKVQQPLEISTAVTFVHPDVQRDKAGDARHVRTAFEKGQYDGGIQQNDGSGKHAKNDFDRCTSTAEVVCCS